MSDPFVTSWTIAHQAPLSMGFSKQEYWSGLSCPPPGDLPDPGIKPASPELASRFFTAEPPGKPDKFKRDFKYVLCLVTQLCPTLCDPMDCSPPGSSVPGDSPGKNTGVSCEVLLQGIFPNQGSNPHLLHWQVGSLLLSHWGSQDLNTSDFFGKIASENTSARVEKEDTGGKEANSECMDKQITSVGSGLSPTGIHWRLT